MDIIDDEPVILKTLRDETLKGLWLHDDLVQFYLNIWWTELPSLLSWTIINLLLPNFTVWSLLETENSLKNQIIPGHCQARVKSFIER